MISLDLIIVLAYLLILISLGWCYKDMDKSTSDYFRGGGNMLWWMIGATAFMTQFTAVTFTGHVGKAYSAGLQIVFIFIGNAIGYFINGYFQIGAKMRQTNSVTGIEIVRKRFGVLNAQVFTWLNIPTRLITGGTALAALGYFTGAALGWDTNFSIIAAGITVVIMSIMGGVSAVIASDYLQMIIVMTISIITAVVVLFTSGGIVPIISNFPADNFFFGGGSPGNSGYTYGAILVMWCIVSIVKQAIASNSMDFSYRYLCAASSKDAIKGAYLATILGIIGMFIWFLPAWYAAAAYPNIAEIFPNLNNPQQASYLLVVKQLMPVGMVGVLIAAMFAATMSSLDSNLNQNSGILIRDVIKPFLFKNMTEKQMIICSKAITTIFGAILIGIGLFISQLKGLTIFDVMIRVVALTQFPIAIPLLLGIYIKKTPEWAPWATMIVGALVSAFSLSLFKDFIGTTGIEFTKREWSDLPVIIPIVSHLVFTGGFFLCTQFFYKGLSSEREKEVDQLFKDFNTPIQLNETIDIPQSGSLSGQRSILGRYVNIIGLGILLLTLFQKNISNVLVISSCSAGLFIIGYCLLRASKNNN